MPERGNRVTAKQTFRVLLVKPSKYAPNGYVERFRKGFMPNATLLHLKSMTPPVIEGRPVVVDTIDEYTQNNLRYLDLLRPETCSLLAVVGVQSHQMHRALDLTALAQANGVRNCVIGGPHVMTCDTSEVHGRGVSFALSEGELVWPMILSDSVDGNLQPVYGDGQRRGGQEPLRHNYRLRVSRRLSRIVALCKTPSETDNWRRLVFR
jgi:hypothetical protein